MGRSLLNSFWLCRAAVLLPLASSTQQCQANLCWRWGFTVQNSAKPEKKCKSGTSRGTAPETDCAVHSLRRAGLCFPLVQPWSLLEASFTSRCRWSFCTSHGAVLTQPWCSCGCCEQALGPLLSFFLCSCHQLISCCLESKGEEKRRKPFILGKTAP